LGVVVVAVATVRLVNDGHRRFQEALGYTEAEDRDARVVSLEDAAKAYVPGSPYTKKALRELVIMAKAAEMRGEHERAAAIWEVTRRSILATRHLFQPNSELLRRVERNIARLSEVRFPRHGAEALTARPKDPSPLLSLLLALGLFSWIAGAALIALRPRSKAGHLLVPLPYAWLTCLGGLAGWLLMAWLA
jgi:hypothetical protein